MSNQLHVQVGDFIASGSGDCTTLVAIVWTNRHYEPSNRDTPVDAVCLVAPVGDGQFAGTAMTPDFLTYLGWVTPTDEEFELDVREGHTWAVNGTGWRRVDPTLLADAIRSDRLTP